MNKTSNASCRLTESEIYGHQAVILENDCLSVGILVGWGLTVYTLVDKKSGVDFMFRDRLEFDRLRSTWPTMPNPQGTFWDTFIGGWFEMFPNAGKSCEWNGIIYPQHGEVMQVPWSMTVLENSPQRLCLEFHVHTHLTPFRLERIMELRAGVPCIFVEEQIHNDCPEPQSYLWGHHFTIGGTFLNERCRIDMPPARLSDHSPAQRANSRILAGSSGTLSAMPAVGGGTRDESVFPSRSDRTNESLFADRMQDSWVAVTDSEKNLGIGLCWDHRAFPAMWLWKEACGLSGFPFFSSAYALSVEPQVSATPILANACADGTAGTLKGNEKKTAWMTVCIYRDVASVGGVSRDGTISPTRKAMEK